MTPNQRIKRTVIQAAAGLALSVAGIAVAMVTHWVSVSLGDTAGGASVGAALTALVSVAVNLAEKRGWLTTGQPPATPPAATSGETPVAPETDPPIADPTLTMTMIGPDPAVLVVPDTVPVPAAPPVDQLQAAVAQMQAAIDAARATPAV